jgi:amino acid exporter
MNPQFHPILTAVALFFLGLVSPGPNFLVVIETTLKAGRMAGVVTGIGAATGDAVYAWCGLFGVSKVLPGGPGIMTAIHILGGSYLLWLGFRMLNRKRTWREPAGGFSHSSTCNAKHFWRGLATDLANPKTIVFFASIFALTVRPGCPQTMRVVMLASIVLTSILWRSVLAVIFSSPAIRRRYQQTEPMIEYVFGAALCTFGVLLVEQAVA